MQLPSHRCVAVCCMHHLRYEVGAAGGMKSDNPYSKSTSAYRNSKISHLNS